MIPWVVVIASHHGEDKHWRKSCQGTGPSYTVSHKMRQTKLCSLNLLRECQANSMPVAGVDYLSLAWWNLAQALIGLVKTRLTRSVHFVCALLRCTLGTCLAQQPAELECVGVDLPETKSVAHCVLKVKQVVSVQRFQLDFSTGYAADVYVNENDDSHGYWQL
eukprot:6490061-Amphidinium_carterae.1